MPKLGFSTAKIQTLSFYSTFFRHLINHFLKWDKAHNYLAVFVKLFPVALLLRLK